MDVKTTRLGAKAAMMTTALLVGLALIFGSLASAQTEPPIELPSVPYDIESAIGVATNAGGTGVATFIFADGVEPWAVLVVKAGTPDGIDRVSVTFSMETKTVTIEAEDAESTNVVTILVNKAFIDDYIAGTENELSIVKSDAVNYRGMTASEDAGGAKVYVFVINHFSIQSIEISPQTSGTGTILGAEGLTAMGWAVVSVAIAVILVAAVVALRKRQ